MGRDKAQVKLAGSSLLQRVLTVVCPLFDDVMLSRRNNDAEIRGARLIEDQLPGRGPAIGVCAALGQAKHPYVFVIACDMPFISAGLIERLVSQCSDYDIVVPVRAGKPEPLCAVYSTACLKMLAERIMQGKRGLVSFIEHTPELRIRRVDEHELDTADPDLRSFVDIDSENALAAAEIMLADA